MVPIFVLEVTAAADIEDDRRSFADDVLRTRTGLQHLLDLLPVSCRKAVCGIAKPINTACYSRADFFHRSLLHTEVSTACILQEIASLSIFDSQLVG